MSIVPWRPELVYSPDFKEELHARRSVIFDDFHRALSAVLDHDSAESAHTEIQALMEYTRGVSTL
jgi:hypothetical protein